MIVGGYNTQQQPFGKTQIIDLTGTNPNCLSVDIPVDYSSVGTFIDNQALVCGGYIYPSGSVADCYSLSSDVR